ncbi:MAG: hypothetical protein WC743_26960 [Mucilaginibacter sp.]|jgi:hypothetical protein
MYDHFVYNEIPRNRYFIKSIKPAPLWRENDGNGMQAKASCDRDIRLKPREINALALRCILEPDGIIAIPSKTKKPDADMHRAFVLRAEID